MTGVSPAKGVVTAREIIADRVRGIAAPAVTVGYT
jgi:hypothetical protein